MRYLYSPTHQKKKKEKERKKERKKERDNLAKMSNSRNFVWVACPTAVFKFLSWDVVSELTMTSAHEQYMFTEWCCIWSSNQLASQGRHALLWVGLSLSCLQQLPCTICFWLNYTKHNHHEISLNPHPPQKKIREKERKRQPCKNVQLKKLCMRSLSNYSIQVPALGCGIKIDYNISTWTIYAYGMVLYGVQLFLSPFPFFCLCLCL